MGNVGPTTLSGSYRTPAFRYGGAAVCEVRGEVVVTGLSSGRTSWPVGKRPGSRGRSLVVCGGLADALRAESASAVCYWWGITPQTVSKWRKALGVGPMTPGPARLRSQSASDSPAVASALAAAQAKQGDPERRRKIAEVKRGKPRPPHVVEAMRRGRTGKPQSEDARRRMSEAQTRRVRPKPVVWTRDHDAMLGEVADAEVARRTGRSEKAVAARRKKLGVDASER